MLARVAAVAPAVASSGCSVVGIRTTEEPSYQVVDHVGPVEIRRYGPRVAAETTVRGDELSARSEGFERLAGYIFGGNTARSSIAMTAPVAQSPAASGGGSAKIEMTAPVAQEKSGDAWQIRFFMPAGRTLESLPVPNDPAVVLHVVERQTVAVLRFTGNRDGEAVAERQRAMIAALADSQWKPAGEPFAWFYDPPWTIPWLRRNEAVVSVTAK